MPNFIVQYRRNFIDDWTTHRIDGPSYGDDRHEYYNEASAVSAMNEIRRESTYPYLRVVRLEVVKEAYPGDNLRTE